MEINRFGNGDVANHIPSLFLMERLNNVFSQYGLIVILFTIFSTIIGCRNKEPDITLGEPKKILLDPGNPGNIELLDIIDTVQYITLETSEVSSIGSISKIVFTEDRIFIGDFENTKGIYCFDTTGAFIFKIQNSGKAPGEYAKLNDFDVDEETDRVIVHDSRLKAFLLYDFSGKFISRHVHGYFFESFSPLDKENVIAYSAYITNPGIPKSPNSNILVFNYKTGKIVETLLQYDEELMLEMKVLGLINNISAGGDTVYIYDYYTNIIYSFKDYTLSPKWGIDFGGKGIPKDFWSGASFDEHTDAIDEGRYIGGLINFQIAGKWVIGYYPSKDKSNFFIYNTEENSLCRINQIVSNKSGNPIILAPPFHTDGKNLITCIEPVWIRKVIENESKAINLPEAFRKVDINSNPILQIIKLK